VADKSSLNYYSTYSLPVLCIDLQPFFVPASMPAAEHASDPNPISIPKDDPLAPKRPVVEPLCPLPPSNLVPDPPKQKEKIPETQEEPSFPEARPVRPPSPPEESKPKEECGSPIDMETFSQILELDDEDDETHDFSWSMVRAYFEQAENKFRDMDDAVTRKDLLSLSESGHFLKGSSAALGLWRVKESCEKIQHNGLLRDDKTDKRLTPEDALKSIQELLKQVKVDNNEADIWLQDFYNVLISESERDAVVSGF